MESTIGCIDERGYIRGFTRRGFTNPRCVLELATNSTDAMQMVVPEQNYTPTLIFDIQRDYTKFIDNAGGMVHKNVEDMFAMHRENHGQDRSCGVSGIGAKPSMYILSGQTPTTLYTHAGGQDDPWLCITAPWDEIMTQGKYTGMIQCRSMTEAEKLEFINDRIKNTMTNGSKVHGTTIRFQTNDILESTLLKNFESIEKCSLRNPQDRIATVLGCSNTSFLLKHYEKQSTKLKLYDYFGFPNAQYYCGIGTYTIKQYTKAKEGDRFILEKDGKEYEIAKSGAGYAKEPSESTKSTRGWSDVGEYQIKIGLLHDPLIFDETRPEMISAKQVVGTYNREHLGEHNDDFLSHYKLVRNSQLIGCIPPPDIKLSSARASGEMQLEIEQVQVYICFNPISQQDNPQDRAMGVQENKNQLHGDAVPKSFTRLVKWAKKLHTDKIKRYMYQTISDFHRCQTPPPIQEEEQEERVIDQEIAESPILDTDAEMNTNSVLSLLQTIAQESSSAADEMSAESLVEQVQQPDEQTVEQPPEQPPEQLSEETLQQPPEEHHNLPIVEPPPPVPVPIQVSAYRKNAVYGHEMEAAFERIRAHIQSNTLYTDPHWIRLFNELSSFEM